MGDGLPGSPRVENRVSTSGAGGPLLIGWTQRARLIVIGTSLALAVAAIAVTVARLHPSLSPGWPFIGMASACLVLAGLSLWGARSLARAVRGIDAMRQRVLAMPTGQRDIALPDARGDMGSLASTLDQLAMAMAARTHELEVERRSIFHQEKMAAVGAMAARVLHDIGNPIAAIDGVARAMHEAHASGDCVMGEGLCDPALILRETARLQGITRMIAGLAAPPSTAAQLLNVNEVVQSALLLLHFDARLAGVHVEPSLDPQLPAVLGVSDALLQMVMNLITNASDAVLARSPAQPLIVVKTAARDDGVEITITDNGCGMSTDVQARAFEPLFTTKPAGRGTGLGLPLCRTVARQHGGDVAVTSIPGQGTQVRVQLALAPSTLRAMVEA